MDPNTETLLPTVKAQTRSINFEIEEYSPSAADENVFRAEKTEVKKLEKKKLKNLIKKNSKSDVFEKEKLDDQQVEPATNEKQKSDSDNNTCDTKEIAYAKWLLKLPHLTPPESLRSLPAHFKKFIYHDFPPDESQLGRKAPVQQDKLAVKTPSIQGEYNIWYGYNISYAFVNSRKIRRAAKAEFSLNVFEHSGITRATRFKNIFKPFCLYFAKGQCFKGKECDFHHRLPTLYDNDLIPYKMDIF